MDSNVTYAAIVYLALFRLSIIAVGAMSIFLGYKLFVQGIFAPDGGEGSGLEAELGTTKFALKNAAPGTFFALFGVIVISVMIINSPPELNYSRDGRPSASTASPETSKANIDYSETFALRGVGEADDIKKLAESLNNYAWDFHDSGMNREAAKFARLADQISPDTAAILDTLAEMLYAEKEYSEALEYKIKAAGLNEEFAKDMEKFRSAARP